MPMYDFQCDLCEKTLEQFFHMSEVPPLVMCNCGGHAHRVYSAVALNFWYVDPREMDAEKEAIDAGMYE